MEKWDLRTNASGWTWKLSYTRSSFAEMKTTRAFEFLILIFFAPAREDQYPENIRRKRQTDKSGLKDRRQNQRCRDQSPDDSCEKDFLSWRSAAGEEKFHRRRWLFLFVFLFVSCLKVPPGCRLQ